MPFTTRSLRAGALARRGERVSTLSKRSGLTLIEILISVVILAVGVLGVTAMQTASLGGSLSTRYNDSCINIVSDAVDRIQVNSKVISEYKSGGSLVIDPQSPTPPTGTAALSDYNAILAKMRSLQSGGMQLENAKLTLAFQSDFPLAGIDTVTASLTWQQKGQSKTCQITNLVYKQ